MSEKQMMAITFAKGYQGPAEVLVRLPHGGVKKFNLLAAKGDDDFPYFEWELTESQARQYAKSGLHCVPVKAKPAKKDKGDN